jgi:Family of unknown function (DUF6788)
MTENAAARAQAKALAKAIAEIGFVLPGTLSERYLTCTHAGCHCHGDPPQLHGPYWYWTRKVNAKTVSKLLRADQVADYHAWFENRKRLRDLVHQLEELSLSVIADDPRTPSRQRRAGASST